MVDPAFDSRACRVLGGSEPFGKRCCRGKSGAGGGDSCESIPAGDLRLHKLFLVHSRNTPVGGWASNNISAAGITAPAPSATVRVRKLAVLRSRFTHQASRRKI